MKRTSHKVAGAVVLALGLTLGNGNIKAQQAGAPNTPPSQADTHQDVSRPADESQLPKINRATGLVGMAVYNHKGERLGRIREVVIDLQTERVAYLVMGVGGVLNVHEKLLPVPLSAFTANADQKHLILRAEKSKLETAIGIQKGNWPSPTNPSWGAEPFWQKDSVVPGESKDANSPDKSSDVKQKSDTEPATPYPNPPK